MAVAVGLQGGQQSLGVLSPSFHSQGNWLQEGNKFPEVTVRAAVGTRLSSLGGWPGPAPPTPQGAFGGREGGTEAVSGLEETSLSHCTVKFMGDFHASGLVLFPQALGEAGRQSGLWAHHGGVKTEAGRGRLKVTVGRGSVGQQPELWRPSPTPYPVPLSPRGDPVPAPCLRGPFSCGSPPPAGDRGPLCLRREVVAAGGPGVLVYKPAPYMDGQEGRKRRQPPRTGRWQVG